MKTPLDTARGTITAGVVLTLALYLLARWLARGAPGL